MPSKSLATRFRESAAEERPSFELPLLHLARKLLERAARFERQRNQDRLRRLPGLQLDFA